MFRFSLLTILLVVSAASAAPATRPATRPLNNQPSGRLLKRLAYIKKITIDSYEQAAIHDAAWDPQARASIAALGRILSEDPASTGDEEAEMEQSNDAYRNGCRDPLVAFTYARFLVRVNSEAHDKVVWHGMAARQFMNYEKYPAYIRAQGLFLGAIFDHAGKDAMSNNPSVRGWKDNSRMYLDKGMELLPGILADKEIPPELILDLIETAGEASADIEGDRLVLVNKAMKMLEQAQASKSFQQTVLGDTMIKYAWDARGADVAAKVPQEAWKPFAERIVLARKLLEEAWNIDQNNCDAPTQMIIVAMAENAPRAEMEKWYKRAMQIDPCNRSACDYKMNYLKPKWHGSQKDVVDYGRELIKQGNWAGGLPVVFCDAEWEIGRESHQDQWPMPDIRLFAQPEVWRAMDEFYREYLKRTPGSHMRRTEYVCVAAWSGHWDVAAQQLKLLGGEPSLRVLKPEQFQQIVEQINGHAPAARR